jgi:hypothetical protein
MRRLSVRLLLGCALAASAACGTSSSTPTTPTTPAPTFTDTFSGTLTINGATNYPFTVNAAGSVTVSLTTVAPDTGAIMGLDLGTWNGTSCAVSSITNTSASQGASVTGTVTGAGTLCARIHDVGALVTSENYTITAVHP